MTTLHTYICPDCGYETAGNKGGFGVIVDGLFFNFRCDYCKEIVAVHVDCFDKFFVNCPECGNPLAATWTPEDGYCPKCGSRMFENDDVVI